MTHRECRGCQQFTFSQNVEDVWKLFEKLVNGPCSHCRGRKASDSPGGFWSRQWSWPFSKIESARYPRITRAKTFRKTAQLSATIRQQFVVSKGYVSNAMKPSAANPLPLPNPKMTIKARGFPEWKPRTKTPIRRKKQWRQGRRD